jgi:hypothetical protein
VDYYLVNSAIITFPAGVILSQFDYSQPRKSKKPQFLAKSKIWELHRTKALNR